MRGKVVLINSHRMTFDLMQIEHDEPLGLLYLSAYLEQRGYDPVVFQGEPSSVREFLRSLQRSEPILAVGLYCDFENRTEVADLGRFLVDEISVPVVLGGPETVGFDAGYLRKARCLAAVIGEGEITLWRLLESLHGSAGDWRQVDGIAYLDAQGTLVKNGPGTVIENLDELPRPAYRRWVNWTPRNKAVVMTGRGCCHSCAFCYEGSLNRDVRLRSVPGVLSEVEELLHANPAITYIAFVDDTFTVSAERVKELCAGLAALRKRRPFHWYCEGHVKVLARHPELLKVMVDAGLVRLQIGIESGVQAVLDSYAKGITLAEIECVVAAAAGAEVPQVAGFFISGGPFESGETHEANKAFCEKLLSLAPGILTLGPSPLAPYPGTAIARHPEAFGLVIDDPHGATTLADYPASHSVSLSREAVARTQQELVWHSLDVMRRLFSEGRVPHERVISSFKLLASGIVSLWYTAVYAELPFTAGYYSLLARGAVQRSREIPADELSVWRPQRIMEIWHDVDFSDGYPRIGTEVLSPLEFELLLHCSGKLTLAEALDRVYGSFSSRFEARGEFDHLAGEILAGFEERHWLAYAPL